MNIIFTKIDRILYCKILFSLFFISLFLVLDFEYSCFLLKADMTLRKNSPIPCNLPNNKRQKHLLESPQQSLNPSREKHVVQAIEKVSEDKAFENYTLKCQQSNLWYIGQYFSYSSCVKDSQGQAAMLQCKVEGCKSLIKYDMSAGTTSGMLNHLKRVHNIFLKKQLSNQTSQPECTDAKLPYSIYSPEYLNIIKGLIYHIIKDKQSLSTTESSGYRYLLSRLHSSLPLLQFEANSKNQFYRFRAPSRCWLATQAVPALFKRCKKRLKTQISQIGHRISITTDGWKNIANCGFVTVTGRYAILLKDRVMVKEKLLDFKSTVGAQVASTVLRQLQAQADNCGIVMEDNLPCFVTSDRGSNIKAAIASTNSLLGIPCLSHVLHRAVLEAIDNSQFAPSVQKVISMAAAFNKSIPRSSHFQKWQSETKQMHSLLPISVSRTRWHGYLDSIMRMLMIQDRIVAWIEYVQALPENDHLNVYPLSEYVCTHRELNQLQSLAYVLWHLRLFDSVAQATTQATGVKYARIIKGILDRLAYIATFQTGPTLDAVYPLSDKEFKITKAVVDAYDKSKSKIMCLLQNKNMESTGQFAKALHKSVSLRYTLPQMDDILLVSFFDPLWQNKPPKWAISRRSASAQSSDIERRIKRRVVDLVKGCTKREDDLKQGASTTIGQPKDTSKSCVSPTALPGQNTTPSDPPLQSSHQSNQQTSPHTLHQDYQHPGPAAPDQLVVSSQDSQLDKVTQLKSRMEIQMDIDMLGRNVHHGQNQFHIGWADDEQGIIVEIRCYLADQENIENTQKYIDPLSYWFDKRSTLPQLFNAAMKVLSVPATSVLSEQVFSGAGNISCKQRSRLSVGTIEKLVLLQRSMAKEDVDNITAEEFREERRRLDWVKKQKVKQAAYDDVFQRIQSATDAALASEKAGEEYVEGSDEQMVLLGPQAFQEEQMVEESEEFMEIDDALNDITEVPLVDNLQGELLETIEGYKMLTRSKLRQLTNGKEADEMVNQPKKLADYLTGGLD